MWETGFAVNEIESKKNYQGITNKNLIKNFGAIINANNKQFKFTLWQPQVQWLDHAIRQIRLPNGAANFDKGDTTTI